MTLIKIVTGQEDLPSAGLKIGAWYVNHANCPIRLEGPNNTMTLLAKSGRVGPKGHQVSKLQSSGPSFKEDRSALLQSKGNKMLGWYTNTYECPNNLIIKIKLEEKATVFGGRHYQGNMFLRVRETGPYCEISFRKGHGLDFALQGRVDRLAPEYVTKHGLIGHFSEMKYMDDSWLDEFVKYEITKPALVSLEESITVHEIDGERVEFAEAKVLRKVLDVF